jgi:Zn-dependent protease
VVRLAHIAPGWYDGTASFRLRFETLPMSSTVPESVPPVVGEVLPQQSPPIDAPPAPGPVPAAEWNEDLYQAACTVLVEPDPAASPGRSIGCLLGSAALFGLSFFFSFDLQTLGFIVGVLFLHEAGHFLGMRAFGYRNVRMFFIPFFGAAVSGKKHAAPAWQQAVVLLLGPLPGLVLASALYGWLHPPGTSWPGRLVAYLVVVNGFNLLPVVPLDGGRLLDVLLFSRRPVLTLAFQMLAVLALLGLAFFLWSWVLGILGGLMLLTAPARYRAARLQRAFRDNPLELPDQLEDLGDTQRRDLFGWAVLVNPLARTPAALAGEMRTLHEHMVSRPPGRLVWLALLALYLAGVTASISVGLATHRLNAS